MSTEEYYHVFESILYAAIVTMIIHGWAKMIIQKDEYKLYWAYLAVTINYQIAIIYKYFIFRTFVFYDLVKTPFDFIFIIVGPLVIAVLAAYLLIPENFNGIDLRQYLVKYRFWIFLAPCIWGVSNMYHASFTTGLNSVIIFSNISFITAYIAFITTKKLRIIEVVMVLSLLGWPFFLLQEI